MKTTKSFQDQPAPGYALLERTQDSFRRSVNGAWLDGGSASEVFEIPLEILNRGPGWFNPGRCGHVSVKLPDGSFLSVSGANDPIRTSGFGPLGTLKIEDREEFVSGAHPLLPNLFVGYYRVAYFADSVAATFEPTRDWLITFKNEAGDTVDTSKTGPFGVTRGFAEHVGRSGLITRPSASSFELVEI